MSKKTSIISTTLTRPIESYEVPKKYNIPSNIKHVVLKKLVSAGVVNNVCGPSFADHVFVHDVLKKIDINDDDIKSDDEYRVVRDCILGIANDIYDEVLKV